MQIVTEVEKLKNKPFFNLILECSENYVLTRAAVVVDLFCNGV